MGFKRDYCEKVSSVGKATAIKYSKQFLVYYRNSEAIVMKALSIWLGEPLYFSKSQTNTLYGLPNPLYGLLK